MFFIAEKLLTATHTSKRIEQEMKKVPLFEYEIPSYRKRPTEWAVSKQTR